MKINVNFKSFMDLLVEFYEKENMQEFLKISRIIIEDNTLSIRELKMLITEYFVNNSQNESLINNFYKENKELHKAIQMAFGKAIFPDIDEESDEKN